MRRLLLSAVIACACVSAAPLPRPSAPPPPPEAPPPTLAARDEAPPERRHTLERDRLPPEFARLSPREREQWHACRAFFLRRRPPGPEATRPSIHLEFTVHVADYLREPAGDARRSLLIDHGCPEGIVELADGTHLDLVEGPKDP